MITNNKFKEELLTFLSKYNYVTQDEDDEVTLWINKPKNNDINIWYADDDGFYIKGFEFSEFADKNWKECIISLDDNISKIDALETEKQIYKQRLSDIQEKINCVEKINNEVDLADYMDNLLRLQHINETNIKDIDETILLLKK